MRALLLSAGLGTRLRPITESLPKCLVPIAGQPLMDYWLALLLENGVERVLVNTHHLPQQIKDHVASSPWRARIDLVHEDELLGTGGTVLHNEAFFGSETFLVAHADNLTWFDVPAFRRRHETRPDPDSVLITMLTFETESPESCGIVEENEDGVVVAFHEKVANPPGRKANGAIYLFEPEILSFLRGLGKEVIDLSTEVLPHFMGRIATYHNTHYLRDIGTPESLMKAERDVAVRADLQSLLALGGYRGVTLGVTSSV